MYVSFCSRENLAFHLINAHRVPSFAFILFSVKPEGNCTWTMDIPTIIDKSVNWFTVVSYSKTMSCIPSTLSVSSASQFFHLHFRTLDTTAKFETDAWIERIIILGYPKNPNKVTINSGDKQAIPLHHYHEESQSLTIRRPGPSVASDWTLTIT